MDVIENRGACGVSPLRAVWRPRPPWGSRLLDRVRKGPASLAHQADLARAIRGCATSTPRSAFQRFCNEWAGCATLGPLGLGPGAYVGNAARGFYLIGLGGGGELGRQQGSPLKVRYSGNALGLESR
jgi:hypothetical protein